MVRPSPKKPVSPDRLERVALLQVALIAVAVLWVFLPALHGTWIWDDGWYIRKNPLLDGTAGLWKSWFAPGAWVDYYPIEATVLWTQWQLWGNNTFGYHLTNVFLHLCSALLVWRLLSKFRLRLAWLGGLLFAIHPVQVESVAWIVELKNTLSLPPFLLTMCAWIDYEEHGRRRDYLLALGFFLVAMLCKISMAPFPLVILLYAWWKRGRIGWGDVKAVIPFLLIALELAANTILAGDTYRLQTHTAEDVIVRGGFFSRLACAGLSLAFYFFKSIWPVGLLPIYPMWKVDPPSLLQFVPWLVLAAILFWCWKERQSWGRHVLLGLGFFLLMIAPFLGFNTVSYMSFTWVMDHFLYIPIIGLIGLAIAGLAQVEQRLTLSQRPIGIGVLAVVLALLAFESHSHAGLFVNETTLWTYTAERNPDSATVQNNLGTALMSESESSLGEAIGHFETAVRLQPDFAEAQNNYGLALMKMGWLPQAIEHFEIAVRLRPTDVQILSSLGSTLARTGQIAEATELFKRAVEINPNDASLHINLGNAYVQGGHFSEAMEQYQQALGVDPHSALAYYAIGATLVKFGHIAEAIDPYRHALDCDPNFVQAHQNLGMVLAGLGRVSEAIPHFEAAIRINPDYAEAHHNLGMAYESAGRLPEAIAQFDDALRLNPLDTVAKEHLARLQAEHPAK